MYDMAGSGDWLFNFGPIFIALIFIIIFISIIGMLFSSFKQWKKNENSPRLTVQAIVKVKRTNVTRHTHHHHDNNHHSHSTSTNYFITFEFESGDRSEFNVSGKEYGMLAEGDIGKLTFQGTRYLDFTRM